MWCCLEAGPRLTLDDIVNDFGVMFGRLSWLDKRIGTGDLDPNLPLWVCKTVGGTTVHWAGASLRFQDHEWKARTTYGDLAGANLLDWPIDGAEMAPLLRSGRGEDRRRRHRQSAAAARQQQLQGAGLRRQGARLQEGPHRQHGDQLDRARWPAGVPAARLLHGRAARSAPSGRRSTPRSPRPRRPIISSCGRSAWRCGSSTTPPAR